MLFVGIDWAYRRAAWCAKRRSGEIVAEGVTPADEDGLAKLVIALGSEVNACVEMMSGAVWVRDRLRAAGWAVEVADARKVKAIAPLACKTDKVDARVLAELCRRDLVPAVWIPSFCDRELRERLNRRAHLVRLRTAAKNRVFGVLSQWGLRIPLRVLRSGDPMTVLERRGLPQVWRRSVAEALAVVDMLDARIAALEAELRPLAHADPRVLLLVTIPGVGEHLGLMIAAEIGDVARFPGASQPDRVRRSGSPRGAVRAELAHGRAVQSRLACAALGGDRSGSVRVAADKSVEPPVPRRQTANR
jgi:transposase